MDMQEFEISTMIFASYLCMIKNKKLNYLNFLKILVDDKKAQYLFCKFVGDDSFQNIVRIYLNSTPNIYKKIFRSKFNKKNDKRNSKKNI